MYGKVILKTEKHEMYELDFRFGKTFLKRIFYEIRRS